jgi:bifunctional UDP-N-acetylglucosamine pyrophosphorylase/glucosamine-1-phosphate N-acetyltransferase
MDGKNCAVILAGGRGKRMKSELPKPMFEVLGEPMLEWVINACENAGLRDICVVKGYNAEVIEKHINGRYDTVLQTEQMGTGHAVMTARDWLRERGGGNVLILNGDAPFIDEQLIKSALEQHTKDGGAVTLITAAADDPYGYGRVLRDETGGVTGIAEEKDASAEQKKIKEINSGAYWFKTDELLSALSSLSPNNSQGEYYLTDSVYILIQKGKKAGAFKSSNPKTVLGANDRKELLALNDAARFDIIDKHLENGVEFLCTDGVTIGRNVSIGAGTKSLRGVDLRGRVSVGENCVIGPDCVIENCAVGSNCTLNSIQAYDSVIEDNVKIGPFTHIRPGCRIKAGAKIGDFVEIKNSDIGEKTAVAHLTYIGDSDVGANVNFGCGVVTVNYDGASKHRTAIGDGAFIGCNTNLIAPVKVGDAAYTAAGTTVTKNVPPGALAIERGELSFREGYAYKKLKKRLESSEQKV